MDTPFDRRMGFRCVATGEGTASYEADVDATWHNEAGRLHGGVLAGLADAAMGAAFAPGEARTNTDLGLRFLRPVVAGTIRAEARTIRAGRRVAVMACDITQDGRLVATAESQFLRLADDG